MSIVRRMKRLVPEFRSQHSVYEVLDKENQQPAGEIGNTLTNPTDFERAIIDGAHSIAANGKEGVRTDACKEPAKAK